MIGSELLTFPSFETDAARFIMDLLHAGLAKSGTFRLGLAGGTTPAAVYTQLAILATESTWDAVEITFGDERCVPPDHPESNFRMAHETLLEKVGLSPGRIHRIRGEISPENAANEYQALL